MTLICLKTEKKYCTMTKEKISFLECCSFLAGKEQGQRYNPKACTVLRFQCMFSQKVLTVALPLTWNNNSHLSLQCICLKHLDWSAIKLAIKLHEISKTHHSPTRHVWIGEAKIGHRYNNNRNDNLHVSIRIKDRRLVCEKDNTTSLACQKTDNL